MIVTPLTSSWLLPSGVNAWPAAVNTAGSCWAGVGLALGAGIASVEVPAIKPAVANDRMVPSVVRGAPPIDRVAPFAITTFWLICVHV